MKKIRIKVITLGHMPIDLNLSTLKNWKSEVFELSGEIENYRLSDHSDGDGWCYTDALLEKEVPTSYEGDLLLAIVNVPLELNWYARNLVGNRVVVTLHEVKEYLSFNNIPCINLVLRILYARLLSYKRYKGEHPASYDHVSYAHDETRGCLFDMTGIKYEVIYSANDPIICQSCEAALRDNKVSTETIVHVKYEISKIRKELFFRLYDFVKRRPILSLIISASSALLLGVLASVIASYIYAAISA